MRTLAILAVLALGSLGVGCYDASARVRDRVSEKVDAFMLANNRQPTTAEISLMTAEAAKEEREERAAELAGAKTDAISGAGKLVTGDYIGGAVLLGGALLAWLGLKPKAKSVPAPTPSAPPAGGGGAT